MDSRTRLDHALFQLTPTRTRCDLLVFSGGITEKVASGLFQPFISHLKFAKDEISKGGYSIALRPPNNDASWFTKATFERFVRFVSTPEVLERFVSLEREILQIEQSSQVNESPSINTAGQLEEGSALPANVMTRKSTDSSKLQGEFQETEDVVHEENSKIRLQRLLETRKALLRKEQAMVYARTLVAGFEMDNIDDLISFAGAFGASRLREACINFTELCKKKHTDGLWMDELAAVQAHSSLELPFFGTSGIVLMNEAYAPNQNITASFPEGGISPGSLVPNGSLDAAKSDSTTSHASLDSNKVADDNLSTTDQRPSMTAKAQVPMQWLNQFPQYLYNFQNHMQQMPPYQGYAYPAIRSVPPYHPRNMESPLNLEESSRGLGPELKYHKSQKSSKGKKEKFPNKNGAWYSGEDSHTEYSESDSGRDIDSYVEHVREQPSAEHASSRRQRKKSSRTVVIRNINYINSKKRDGENNGVSSESSLDENEFIDGDLLQQKVEEVVGSLEKHRKPKSCNNNKVEEEKSHYIVNGSNGATQQDFDNLLIADASERVKRNENWDTFQNLLMRDKETTIDGAERQQPVDVQDEHFTIRSSEDGLSFAASHVLDLESKRSAVQRTIVADSFVVTEREGGNGGGVRLEDFENEENLLPRMKRRDYADEELLFPQRLEESGSDLPSVLSDRAANSSIIKNRKGEDWFISNHSGKSENLDGTQVQTIIDNDHVLSSEGQCMQTENSRKDALVDDSFMVQARSANDLYDSQWKTDISMIADLSLAAQPENETVEISQDMHDASRAREPDDLCIILARDSVSESARASWTPKIDYGIDISFVEADKRGSNITANDDVDEKLPSNCKSTDGKNRKVPGTKDPSKETESRVLRGSLGKSKSEITSKSKKPSAVSRPTVRKSKLEEEEEIRKKMEELSIQRQKRISERTAANGLTPTSLKKVPTESKTKKASFKSDKNRAQSTTRGMN